MTKIDTSTEAVERLLENVTPGPWRDAKSYRGIVSDSPSGYDDAESVHAYGGHMVCESVMDHNRPFIAAARDLVPALLKERDEARARSAAAFEMAADACARTRVRIANGPMPEGARFDYEQAIHALITVQERDALNHVRAEAMREAADWLVTLETAAGEADISERREGIRDAASAIRRRADKIKKGEKK